MSYPRATRHAGPRCGGSLANSPGAPNPGMPPFTAFFYNVGDRIGLTRGSSCEPPVLCNLSRTRIAGKIGARQALGVSHVIVSPMLGARRHLQVHDARSKRTTVLKMRNRHTDYRLRPEQKSPQLCGLRGVWRKASERAGIEIISMQKRVKVLYPFARKRFENLSAIHGCTSGCTRLGCNLNGHDKT